MRLFFCFVFSLGLYAHTSLAAAAQPFGHSATACRLKPGADIQLQQDGPLNLPLGQITPVNLPLDTAASEGQLQVTLSPAEGLEVLDTPQPLQIQLPAQATPSLALSLRAKAPGQYLLSLMATLTDTQGHTSRRAMALVVQAGSAPQMAQKASSPLPLGFTPVVALPALEVIE